MTPGTAAARRKTVTFGTNVEHELKKDSKSGIPDDCPGKFPSPWVPKDEEVLPLTRRTNLTQTLENARESTKKSAPSKDANDIPDPESPSAKNDRLFPIRRLDLCLPFPQKKEVEVRKHGTNKVADAEMDFTVDLNEPRSQSGRHWKREYEKYHEEAQERMGHLIRYKELAKDYAKIKDDEAVELREQLEQEQQNVVNMESYIAKLISAIEDRTKSGDSSMTPELTKELARQTALNVQYKAEVEQFRAALEKGGVIQTSPAERALVDARREVETLKAQLAETTSLRSEVKKLKLDLTLSERKMTKAKEENSVMAQQLEQCRADREQFKADLERSEREKRSLEEHAKKRSDVLQNLQKDYESLKQLAKKHWSDAEIQLEQRNEQAASLRKELLSSRYLADSSESEKVVRALQQKIAAHDKIRQQYEDEIAELRSKEAKDLNRFNLYVEKQPKRNSSLRKVFGGSSARLAAENESQDLTKDVEYVDDTEQQDQTINVDRFLDSVVRTPNSKSNSPQKENRSMLPLYTHTTTPRSSPLKEITNSTAKAGASEVKDIFTSATPGISQKFADMSLDSVPRSTNGSRPVSHINYKASPRPSIYNLEGTPVKARGIGSMASGAQGSSRASSLSNRGSQRARTAIPPERAAAARAKLEQRQREREMRKMQEAE